MKRAGFLKSLIALPVAMAADPVTYTAVHVREPLEERIRAMIETHSGEKIRKVDLVPREQTGDHRGFTLRATTATGREFERSVILGAVLVATQNKTAIAEELGYQAGKAAMLIAHEIVWARSRGQ